MTSLWGANASTDLSLSSLFSLEASLIQSGLDNSALALLLHSLTFSSAQDNAKIMDHVTQAMKKNGWTYEFVGRVMPKGFSVEPAKDSEASAWSFFLGMDRFTAGRYEEAEKFLAQVQKNHPLFDHVQNTRLVALHLSGHSGQALRLGETVLKNDENEMTDIVRLNMGRVAYELKQYVKALGYYAKVSRLSQWWTDALYEGAWSFFYLSKPNNTLGNLHTLDSPFFENEFLPEVVPLKATTLLRQCAFGNIAQEIQAWTKRYDKNQISLQKMATTFEMNAVLKNDEKYFSKIEGLSSYLQKSGLGDLLDSAQAIRVEKVELKKQKDKFSQFFPFLIDPLETMERNLQTSLSADLTKWLIEQAENLTEWKRQLQLVEAETLLGKMDVMRRRLAIRSVSHAGNFIGGMEPLVVGQELEYWPFEKDEYWQDELGGYVYNMESQCPKGE